LAFTLIEVVFAITIIAILLSILLPAMSSIKLSAQKVKDVSNLQKIAEAWRECVINRGWTFGEGDGGDFWALESVERLAGVDKSSVSDMVLNDPYVWISSGDKYASKIIKDTICRFDSGTGKVVITYPDLRNSCFSNVSNSFFSGYFVLSYCFIAHGPISNVPLDTTPLAFTRGLCSDGTWDEQAGLYGSKGGYVVYCDGHVVWFDGSKPAKFLKWDQSGYTSDIHYAVPLKSEITCGHKKINTGSNSKLITWERGI
jgi:hypothetical protein